MEKVEGKRCYRVFNVETGTEHAQCTSKKKAEAQLRLLRGVEKGTFKPTGAPPKPTKGMSWRQYFVENTKGKKIKSMPEHMKMLSEQFKKMKSE